MLTSEKDYLDQEELVAEQQLEDCFGGYYENEEDVKALLEIDQTAQEELPF